MDLPHGPEPLVRSTVVQIAVGMGKSHHWNVDPLPKGICTIVLRAKIPVHKVRNPLNFLSCRNSRRVNIPGCRVDIPVFAGDEARAPTRMGGVIDPIERWNLGAESTGKRAGQDSSVCWLHAVQP